MENKNTIEITKARILELVPKFLNEILEADYSNPVKDAVKEAITENEGQIKKLVNEVISESLTTPEFKNELSKQVIAKILERGLRL